MGGKPFVGISAILLGCVARALAQSAGDVVITEIMYDSKASSDEEWVELYNRTNASIDLGGWRLGDSNTPGSAGTEGYITVPNGTSVPAGGYVVVSASALSSVTGEIVCAETGSFALANGGDNLWLISAASTMLIDGSATVPYPDECGTNVGDALERIDPSAAWSGNTADWDPSTNPVNNAEIRCATPAARNSVCESSAPGNPYGLAVVWRTDVAAEISWTNPGDADLQGVLVLRGATEGADPTSAPATGTTYAAGDTIGSDVVAFVGAGTSAQISYPQVQGAGWIVHAFAFDEVRNYSGGVPLTTPLPVQLGALHAVAFAGGVSLRWSTETEANCLGFAVERTADGAEWTPIGFVDGAGTSNVSRAYAFVDPVATRGMSASRYGYRLRQVDRDGDEHLSETVWVTVGEAFGRGVIRDVYPNPAAQTIHVVYAMPAAGSAAIAVLDTRGRIVVCDEARCADRGGSVWTVDVRALPPGVYAVAVWNDGFTDVRTFTVR